MTYMRKKGGTYSSCERTVKKTCDTNNVTVNDLVVPGKSTPQEEIRLDTITPTLSIIKIVYDCIEY